MSAFDLTKRVELYYGKPKSLRVSGEMLESAEMQAILKRDEQFWAIFFQNDLPADVHNRTAEQIGDRFGANTDFARQMGTYVRLYTVEDASGEIKLPGLAGRQDKKEGGKITAESLRESGFRAGGFSFDFDIAMTVLDALKAFGYRIEKKYQ